MKEHIAKILNFLKQKTHEFNLYMKDRSIKGN